MSSNGMRSAKLSLTKEPVDVERLWHIWNMNGPDLSLSCEICSLLKENELLYELEIFLRNLPIEKEYMTNETLNRARVKVAFWRGDFESVYRILQNNCYSNAEDLIDVWDSCHYKQEEKKKQIKLTPLMRFRIRQRCMPPKTILPSGKRKKTTLPKESTQKFRVWFNANKEHPYPSRHRKLVLAEQTGLTKSQVSTWFANARRRLYRKMKDQACCRKDKTISKESSKNVKKRQEEKRLPRLASVHSPGVYPDRESTIPTQSPGGCSTSVKWLPSNQPSSLYWRYGSNMNEPGTPMLFHKVDQCLSKPFVCTEDFPMKNEYMSTDIDPMYREINNYYPTAYPCSNMATMSSSNTITSSNGSCMTDAAQILVNLQSLACLTS